MVLDHGESPIERVVRADELRVEVYGEAPSRSKQVITAWRDTTFLPNRMRYHRDHLGIIANDFGGTIRLGEGDEVRDVPHPLSRAGLDHYRFAVGDTVTIAGSGGSVHVVAVAVRPADPGTAGVVGSMYLDLDRAALVRFRFTFTPSSFRDPTVEDITVELENGLQDGKRWLPWRQAIAIRRGTSWLDLPYRTVIRADWTIDSYRLGVAMPPGRFAGALIDGPRRPVPGGDWATPLAASLETMPADAAQLEAVRREAGDVLSGRLLDGLPRFRLGAGGVSDVLHANRVGGITTGFGVRLGMGAATTLSAHAAVGFSDHRLLGDVRIERRLGPRSWWLDAARDLRDVGDLPVISGLLNTMSTMFSGRDLGDYTLVEHAGVGISLSGRSLSASVELGFESSRSVINRFRSISGLLRDNPPLGAGDVGILRITVAHRDRSGAGWTFTEEATAGDVRWIRASVAARREFTLGGGAVATRFLAGVGSSGLPGYRAYTLGGRGTLVGLPFRLLGGRRVAFLEVRLAHSGRAAHATGPLRRPDSPCRAGSGPWWRSAWSGERSLGGPGRLPRAWRRPWGSGPISGALWCGSRRVWIRAGAISG